MNKKQRWILFVCAAVIVFMLLFPPYQIHWPLEPKNMGYAFLFDVPEYRPTVNVVMLLVQWVGVILVGGILWFALRDKGSR